MLSRTSDTLREQLREMDSALADTADTLWRIVKPILAHTNRPDSHENGYPHAEQVEKNIWKLIRDTDQIDKFCAEELFLLSCSACCHDLDKGLDSALPEKPPHGAGSQKYMEGDELAILLTIPVRQGIGDIISLHDEKVKEFDEKITRLEGEYAIREKVVDLQCLAVLLKAADILHTDASRTPLMGVKEENLSARDKAKLFMRRCVGGWKIDGATIILQARPRTDEEKAALHGGYQFMCSEEWPAVETRLHRMFFPNELELEITRDGKVTLLPSKIEPVLNLHQISEPAADFVGREEEIEILLAAFEDVGKGAMISGLRGMGGIGKTELARVIAKRLKEHFPDGQIEMNLRGVSDGGDAEPATAKEVLQHIIRSFQPEKQLPDDIEGLRGWYNSVLDGKRVLLFLDNVRDAAQVAPLTPLPDGCALIITSRYHFSLAGMQAVNLDILPLEEARELLLEICPRIGDQAEVLAERCGYLPLALRLAASALETRETLAVDDYLVRLADEKERLVTLDEYRVQTAEARGVGASLAISYELLNPALQQFWCRLAVFPGDFDAEAAAAVGEFPDMKEAEKALGDLHAASMAQWEAATQRFRLHDLARDYACTRLRVDERVRAEQRHAEYYVEVLRNAENLYLEGGYEMMQGLALFDREWENIRTGQAWAAAHWQTDRTAAELCSDYPGSGAYFFALRLHARDWISWLEIAVTAARKLEDLPAEGVHLGNLGCAYKELGEPHKAIEYHEQALVIDREVGFQHGEGASLGNLGSAYCLLNEPFKAIEYFKQQLVVVQEISDRRGEGNALWGLGIAYFTLGEREIAITYFEQQLAIARETGDRLGEGAALKNMAGALAKTGRSDEAIVCAEQAVEIFEQLESPNAAMARAWLEDLRGEVD